MKSVRNFSHLGLAAVLAIAIAGCAPVQMRQTPAEYADDAWITSKVARAFVKVPELSVSEIKVDAFQGEIQLSGFVADAGDVGRAAAVAGGIDGVKAVRNDILVK